MSARTRNSTHDAKTAGQEPLPGYRLIEPLGRGGFGEVWKCEAPGGLHKAIKFVTPRAEFDCNTDQHLRMEFEAFNHIKAIRHPFLLTLERVELLDGELVMVMELADKNLLDRFQECRDAGQPGIPRDDLLVYLADAADALDTIADEHHLQHLDVKPANLFVVGCHAKVGDFGLVRPTRDGPAGFSRSLSPRYASPEACAGKVSSRADQYSLALTFTELLTGQYPYQARSVREQMDLHRIGQPDLSALPPTDRAAVGRALAKLPNERFASCTEFLRALVHGVTTPPPSTRSALIRFARRQPVSPVGEGAGEPATTDFVLLTTVAGDTSPVAQLGRAFPGYRFIEEVEYGHRGRVVRAADPVGRVKVVRLLAVEAKADSQAAVRLAGIFGRMNPLQQVSALHPRLIGFSHDEDGMTFRELRKHRASSGENVEVPELLRILGGVAARLDATADEHGFGHLLVRPETIVVREEAASGVIDHGVGELLRVLSPDLGWVGTDPYPAPELRVGRPGPRSDQYSLACVFLEMTDAWEAVPRRGRGGNPLAELKAPERLTEVQLAALRRATHVDPEQRFESCAHFLAALDGVAIASPERRVRLDPVRTLVAVSRLEGVADAGAVAMPPAEFLEHLIVHACGTADLADLRTPPILTKEGQYHCRFPAPSSRRLVLLALKALRTEWSVEWTATADDEYSIRTMESRSFWKRRKGVDQEVTLSLPPENLPGGVGDADLAAACPQPGDTSNDTLRLMAAIRDRLRAAVYDRRQTFRVPTTLAAQVYPLDDTGGVFTAIPGACQDISAGGFHCVTRTPIPSTHAFLRFPGVPKIAEYAILARLCRNKSETEGEASVTGQFFTDD